MLSFNVERQLEFFTLQAEFCLHNGITVLSGPSGSGKTTILRLIAGLMHADRGRIVLDDNTLYDKEENIFVKPQERRVALVFQDYALFPHMNVLKNVCYGKYADKAEGEEFLKKFGIAHLASRRPTQLSGGEKQRVALARALASKPKLLLLDEPFSALDSETKNSLHTEIVDLQQSWQIPFLVVSHDERDVEKLGARELHIEKGKLI